MNKRAKGKSLFPMWLFFVYLVVLLLMSGLHSGLLVAAETEQEGRVIYRMTASALQTPCPATASFRLPDGQVLHQVG